MCLLRPFWRSHYGRHVDSAREADPLGKKNQPYECGIDPVGTTRDPVPVKFFMVAISFILFDIEVIFLLPWAVVARDLGMFGFVAMVGLCIARVGRLFL